jgi:hypothetical protein
MSDAMPFYLHPGSWVEKHRLGQEVLPYRPTFDFRGSFIDASHAQATGDTGIEGWLLREDAFKLYEMAYFARGNVLELGSYHGLSTTILARALQNANRGYKMLSVENNPDNVAKARKNTAGYEDVLQFIVGDAHAVCRKLLANGDRFAFCFVDHSHTYEMVHLACNDLKELLMPGGFAFFHDYNDGRNGRDPRYGVYQAVLDAFGDRSFSFVGAYGCGGLFVRGA